MHYFTPICCFADRTWKTWVVTSLWTQLSCLRTAARTDTTTSFPVSGRQLFRHINMEWLGEITLGLWGHTSSSLAAFTLPSSTSSIYVASVLLNLSYLSSYSDDSTRVKLSYVDDDPSSDYINASYIPVSSLIPSEIERAWGFMFQNMDTKTTNT